VSTVENGCGGGISVIWGGDGLTMENAKSSLNVYRALRFRATKFGWWYWIIGPNIEINCWRAGNREDAEKAAEKACNRLNEDLQGKWSRGNHSKFFGNE